ncbi:mechanosensitive ion channel family protein [Aquisalinus luteolus]|uniref:Small conductance mechanosensitive ion channel protein YbdG n=2 Tax=Aquisalinus luteolus TaxID=1566827 RepID=A0A8J3A3S5_9PROT|nr:mechanosensitive ion channel family protein [Aquisalinus luteolus]GGH97943.1 small conductance mechanosensitive ion channel protein YbdG [Aquisalinus luteolus]
MLENISEIMRQLGMPGAQNIYVVAGLALAAIAILAFLANFITRLIIHRIVKTVIKGTATTRDDILLRHRVFERLSQLAPALIIYWLAPQALAGFPQAAALIVTLSFIYMVVIGVLFLDGLLNAGLEIYRTFPMSRQMPIRSFVQVGKLLIYLGGFISVLSLLLGESPVTFLAGLGALAAVFMFVFKDPILGFVAGIQLSSNRMVAIGDWITMKKYDLDGDVEEIALTTVKVRNFDKTITTVPTQALINESFRNWRGMQETGGRRIKRSIHVDLSTIRFLSDDDIARLSRVQQLKPYIEEKTRELATHNDKHGIDPASLINGRRMTNVGTFRAWLEFYLKNHPMISKDLTFLVRQLEPVATGLPIEIYVFTTTTIWTEYESIQADIFDHILAAAREFDLRIYQQPSGADIAGLKISPQVGA